MTLCLTARTRLLEQQERPTDAQPLTVADEEEAGFRKYKAQEKLSSAINLAHAAAEMLRDFRARYGLKICPAWLLQLQAVTAGVLLLDPALTEPPTAASPMSDMHQDASIQDSHTAFDEVFRCLIGTSVEVMIGRAIARMVYHTALDQKVALSPSTRSMLQIMSSTAWRPSDLNLVNSTYPNFATTKGHQDQERMSQLLSKWEKLDL